jgi:small subunit ribosomal protein S17
MPVKEKIGIVISNKMDKSIVISVENKYPHPIYNKIMVKTKKYLAHDEEKASKIGDTVLIEECRPLSKRKCWTLKKIISKSLVN